MKTKFLWKCGLGLALAALPLVSGCYRETILAAATETATTNSETTVAPAVAPSVSVTNTVEKNLETAPGKIVSTATPPTTLKLSAPALEIIKLAHAGVDEGVMLAFVTNSVYVFNLTPDDIIYLNDVGISGAVVTAMIQRDESLKKSFATVASAPQPYTNQLVPAPGAPTPYSTPPYTAEATTAAPAYQAPTEVVEYVPPAEPVNVSYSYFYDSLAPYGNWIDIGGYGPCWRPTVVVSNPGWQPYCNRGRWVYSDCGWYWASDYSWGWAPFHYGRWFSHSNYGWCWAPDTVWGASWVSWRYTPNHCGWAPLPPAACYTSGVGFTYYGRSVGVSFGFGLAANRYTFVPVNNFRDRNPYQHRLPSHQASQVFNNTVVVNDVGQDNNQRVINHGIPVRHVAGATRTPIQPVPVRDADSPVNARMDRRNGGLTLAAYRPNLPQPQPTRTPTLTGEGVRPATRNELRHASRVPAANQNTALNQNITPVAPRERHPDSSATARTQPAASVQTTAAPATGSSDSATTAPGQRNAPIIMRGPARPRTWPTAGANNANPSVALNQPAPATAQPTLPIVPGAQNNGSPAIVNQPQQRRYNTAQPSTQYSPAPNVVQPNQRIRQETPRYQQQQDQRVFTQPTPAQRQPAAPAYQTPTYQAPAYQAPVYQAPARQNQAQQAPAQQAPQRPGANQAPAQSGYAQPSRAETRQAPAQAAPAQAAPAQPAPPQQSAPAANNFRPSGGRSR